MPDHGIAIVNSDRTLLAVLHEVLTESGYQATAYFSDDDTYQQVRAAQPALLVLDVGLGTAAAGWTLLKHLQRDPHTAHIPILITTVDHAVVVEKAKLLRAQGCAILELPVRFAALHAHIQALLNAQ